MALQDVQFGLPTPHATHSPLLFLPYPSTHISQLDILNPQAKQLACVQGEQISPFLP